MIAEDKAVTTGLVRLALVALCAGAVTGVAGALFRLALMWADKTRLEVLAYSHQYPYLGWLIPVIAAAVCVAIARFLVRLEPLASGSGVQHVEAVMRGEAQPAPRGVVPVKFVGGVLAIGAGMVLGREGPTVQMGSVIGSSLGRWLRLREEDIASLQAATAGAGLAVAFNAPLGGAIFVFEEVAHAFRTRLALMTLMACGTAMAVAQLILGDPREFHVAPPAMPGIWTLLPYVGLGLLLGALSVAYNWLVVKCLDLFNYYARLPVELRAALIGALIGAIGWLEPRLIGGGDDLNQQVLTGGLSLSYAGDPVCHTLVSRPGFLFCRHARRLVCAAPGRRCALRCTLRRHPADMAAGAGPRPYGLCDCRDGRLLCRRGAGAVYGHRAGRRDDGDDYAVRAAADGQFRSNAGGHTFTG